MNTRKRTASEALLPTTRSSKHPRTTRDRVQSFEGENPSPSQSEGILSRWINLGYEAVRLIWDTTSHFLTAHTSPETTPVSSSSPSSETKNLLVKSPTRHYSSLSRPPIPSPFRAPARLAHPSSKFATPASSTTWGPAPSAVTGLSSTCSQLAIPLSPLCDTPHIPSTRFIPSVIGTPAAFTIEDIRELAAKKASSIIRASPYGTTNRYQKRAHIHEKIHKAQIMVVRKKDREEMEQELFAMRRSTGYSSDFKTFQGFLTYKEKLERNERWEALSSSPSLIDLRSASTAPPRVRRHSDGVSPEFLRRAIEKAKQSFNGPKAPRPLIPSVEELDSRRRAADEAIDSRIRPKRARPPKLSADQEAEVDAVLQKTGIISRVAKEQVTDRDLQRLMPSQWLNDELINFYGQMILDRSEAAEACKENASVSGRGPGGSKPLNVHYFSTFFWSKLRGDGYEKGRLAKWTKKFDIFKKDIVLIPINHNNSHWTGAAINFRQKRIESYDSMGMDRSSVHKFLRQYLDAEHRNKKKKPFNFDGWEDHSREDTPQQENGFDCGVFTCHFLESLSRGEEEFDFSQHDMPALRRRMIWEIARGKLYDR